MECGLAAAVWKHAIGAPRTRTSLYQQYPGCPWMSLPAPDCVHVETPGFTPSERTLEPTFERIFAEARGRIVIATFASLISRVQQVLDIAATYERKVAPVGRSIEKNVDIAVELGYLHPPEGTLITQQEADVKDLRPQQPIAVIYAEAPSGGVLLSAVALPAPPK